jgi:hypothetical protein
MKPSEQCKKAGLKSLAELAQISGESVQTLNNWHKNKPFRFDAVLESACASRGIHQMKINISGTSVVRDYLRRDIAPDRVETVEQGLLLMWLFCNSYVCEMRSGAKSLEREPGELAIAGGPYINTYSPQEIANDLVARVESP